MKTIQIQLFNIENLVTVIKSIVKVLLHSQAVLLTHEQRVLCVVQSFGTVFRHSVVL